MALPPRDVRASTLEQSLRNLGVEKLSKDDIIKMPWESLEGKIKNWIQYMRIAVRIMHCIEGPSMNETRVLG